MKSILVAGGAGFVGSHLVDRLLRRSDVDLLLVVDNLWTGRIENLSHVRDPRFFFEPCDVEAVRSHRLFDEIYHLASPASPPWYMAEPERTITANLVGAMRLRELLKKGGRFCYTSSSEVYGDPQVHPQTEDYWGHVNPLGPRSCYDEGKRVAESLCMNYHLAHGVEVRIIRIFNTYGPRMAQDDGRVISNFITQALRNQPLTIYGDGKQTRSFCYVDDLIEGMIRMMNQDREIGPVNLGNPVENSMIELATKVLEITGSQSELKHVELPADDPKQRCPNITRARQLLDWSPQVDLNTGLQRAIQFYRDLLRNERSRSSS